MEFPHNIIAAFFSLNVTWFILAFVAIVLDLLTGFVIKGVIPHKVSSSVMREGLVHKAWECAIIICAALVDIAIAAGLGLAIQPLSAATCAFIFLMELASICENALEGNPELASAPLVKYVSQAKDEALSRIDPDATAELNIGKHSGGSHGNA